MSAGCASSPPHRSRKAQIHVVQKGENLYRISKRYGVSVDAIRRANGIRDVTTLQVGQRLTIPSGGSVAKSRSSGSKKNSPSPTVKSKKKTTFAWPVKGIVTSSFGRRSGRTHEGIDISVPWGTLVHASAPGRVIYSGNGMRDYGNVVVIKHEGHFVTVYAHNTKNLVKYGQFVERGQKIAKVGKTGNVRAKGPILHFEVRARKKPVDPLGYLP
jgi:murein DD-endopeptidase MepM/ murein hydrolase activator NlpD